MERSERFRGRLMAGDKIVLEEIEGLLRSHKRPGGAVGEWTGHFELPDEAENLVVEGNRYRIVLIDGRSGTVSVRIRAADDAIRRIVQFHGTGMVRG